MHGPAVSDPGSSGRRPRGGIGPGSALEQDVDGRQGALEEYEAYRKSRSVFEPVILDLTTRDLVLEIDASFGALEGR